MTNRRVRIEVAVFLFVATLIVFRPAMSCDFINFDDPSYVQNNPILYDGLSLDSVGRAFTTVHAGYWIPLTWLSYLLDYAMSGLSPGGYHRTNVLLHAATVALLYVVLCRMTDAPGRSFVVAALFAFHPVQVESVAWVTERKDVLSTFFAVLTLLAYHAWTRAPGVGRYLLMVLCLALGLMAKPMLVTLPVALLILDYWPLNRGNLGIRRLVFEKLPLLVLCLAAGVATILTQRQGTAVRSLEEFSLCARLGNAVVSYAVYLRMLLFPYPLAVFYPHPGDDLPAWQVALSAVVLLGLFYGAWKLRKAAPYLLAGWLWYLVTLAPVSGVLQAGWQGRADRFLYLPSIGLFVAVCWGYAAGVKGRRRQLRIVFAGVVLLCCVVATFAQQQHWRDSQTLWRHTVRVTDDNFVARDSLAAALLDANQTDEAIKHLERAIEMKPTHELAYYLLGLADRQQKRPDDAARHLREAITCSPDYVDAHVALAEVLAEIGKLDEAEVEARHAIDLDPNAPEGHAALSAVLRARKWDEIMVYCMVYPRLLLTTGLRARKWDEEALEHLREAVRLGPHARPLRELLVRELKRLGRADEAEDEEKALRRLLRR